MRNNAPTPVTCALCGATHGFDLDRCWVKAGFHGQLYALCTPCLDDRMASVGTGANGQAVFNGTSTLQDLERRVERLEARRDS